MAFYDAPHALNARARRDRVLWPAKRLRLKLVDQDELAKLPELRWTSNGARGCSACVATLPQVGAATVAARAGVAAGNGLLVY